MSTQNHLSLVENYLKTGSEIQGWLSDGAISIIENIDRAQDKFDIKGHICEIGVHHGRLFILLYLLTKPSENGVAVDIFDKQELNIDRSGEGNLKVFLNNLKHFAESTEKLKIIAEDSTQLSADEIKTTAGGEVRIFSVDGGHTVDITRSDLRIASKSICEGGVIILDDYFNEAFPGVSEGTNLFFIYDNNEEIVPFAIGGNKLFLTSRSYANKYIDYLMDCNIGNQLYSKQQELFGNPVIYIDFTPPSVKSKIAETDIWKTIKDKPLGKLIKRLVSS